MTTAPTTVNVFVTDPAFLNQKDPLHQYLNTSDVAQLTRKSLSFFSSTYVGTDVRTPSTRVVNWPASTNPSIVVDDTISDSFVTAINSASVAVRNAFFALLDRICFYMQPTDTQDSLNTVLINDPVIKTIYGAGSLQVGTTTSSGTVYLSDGTTVTVNCPQTMYAEVDIPVGSTPMPFGVTFWVSNSAFVSGYPISDPVAVVPPMSYSDVLNAPLNTTSANPFTVAGSASELNFSLMKDQLNAVAVSGYTSYTVTVYDTSGNTQSVPFNILYRGREPSSLQVTDAIKEAVLASGVGDSDSWKARIPELFIVSRFYLIPIWDNVVDKPDQVMYASILNTASGETKIRKIFSAGAYLNQVPLVDTFVAPYNRMPVVSVPDISNPPASKTLQQMYPDFQCYGASDPNFAYMTKATQQFSKDLTACLAAASGNASPNANIRLMTANGMSFYVFSEGNIEFLVMTPKSYSLAIGGTGP